MFAHSRRIRFHGQTRCGRRCFELEKFVWRTLRLSAKRRSHFAYRVAARGLYVSRKSREALHVTHTVACSIWFGIYSGQSLAKHSNSGRERGRIDDAFKVMAAISSCVHDIPNNIWFGCVCLFVECVSLCVTELRGERKHTLNG